MICGAASGACPRGCECKWKDGRRRWPASRPSSKVIPRNLDPSTQVLDLQYNNLKVLRKDASLTGSRQPPEAWCLLPPSATCRACGTSASPATPHFSPPMDAFSATPELVRLDLSNNSIYSLEDNAFRGLARLEVLKVLVPLMALHGLHLNENPWRCDCSLRPLRRWMIDHKIAGIVSAITPGSWPQATRACPSPAAWRGTSRPTSVGFTGKNATKMRYKVRDSVFNNTAKVSNLTIGKVRAKDQGIYWCVAQNKAGRAEANVTLEVSNEISEYRLVAINPAYMTGGLLSGLGFLVTILLLVSCIIHRRQRVRRFRRQEEDREGREMLAAAQSSMSRGSSVIAQPEVADYHAVPSGDLDDAPLHPLQAKQSYLGRGAANGHYARENYTEKIQRYSDAVSDPRRYKDDLEVDLRLSPSTVSYVELASNDLARTRSDLGEKMSLKNLEHETDILRRECSPTGSVVSMISTGPYPDLLDLPYVRRHEEYQQGFHSLNSNLGSITRKYVS
ncbi:LOW QUALITY PROTEIN: uncharacterized protein LOC119569059 [Penaeus monodon]|uniref:LOW QUALITY PROTEIN: uncharacterized protein LOC119569059 n=1 Tax=Penaeus monodon TaxID=6687 RepID=UPI0018A6DF09|nr:LOW QUALITY PROTEIN: uncharacterized protein LOC119569059 [Penaeus monodon]